VTFSTPTPVFNSNPADNALRAPDASAQRGVQRGPKQKSGPQGAALFPCVPTD
jgi:hypothetical protein